MSVLHTSEYGWIISHENYIKNIYQDVQTENKAKSYQLKQLLFNIKSPYLRHNQNNQDSTHNLKRKRKKITSKSNFEELITEVTFIEKTFETFTTEPNFKSTFTNTNNTTEDNKEAQNEADKCYNNIDKLLSDNFHGQNTEQAIKNNVNDAQFLFPKSCRFFCKNINEMKDCLKEEFDVILLDPPWWNKYIRRKNARGNQGYQMMYNLDLSVIPVNDILSQNGLVIVWCTNSPQHLKDLRDEIFPKWGIRFVTKWYWLKVTTGGVPICSFSEPPGKQPFEQIIFGVRENNKNDRIPRDKLVVSIPSALHSHKPPLAEYVGENARCLEIFARYLLPGWTSWGLEVLKLQHECLYEEI